MEMQRQGGWGPDTGVEADDDMEMALRMSQQDFQQQPQQASEEDEIQKAIALSLEGGGGVQVPAGQSCYEDLLRFWRSTL